jgi:hypothetical protein
MVKYVTYSEIEYLASFLGERKDKDLIGTLEYKKLDRVGFISKKLNAVTQESLSTLSSEGRDELDILIHNLSLKNQFKFLYNLFTRKFQNWDKIYNTN